MRVLARIAVSADGRVSPAERAMAGGWVQQWSFIGDAGGGLHGEGLSVDVDFGSSIGSVSGINDLLGSFALGVRAPRLSGDGGGSDITVRSMADSQDLGPDHQSRVSRAVPSSVDHLAVDRENPVLIESTSVPNSGAVPLPSPGREPRAPQARPPVLFLSASVYGRLCDGVLVGMFTHNILGRGTFSVKLQKGYY